jgi:hypothetical protein
LGDVGRVGGGALDRVHQARGDINPDMGLHAEVPLVALPGLMHLPVAALLFVSLPGLVGTFAKFREERDGVEWARNGVTLR